jgi:Bacterial HORMA domain family 1
VSATFTRATSFTVVHARNLASKVAADMNLCAHYYGNPSEQSIRQYAEELAQYLNAGYVEEYEFGFQKDNKRVVTWRYKIDENGVITTDDRPGKVVPSVDIAGASYFNFLTRNARFFRLTGQQRAEFEAELPFQRSAGEPPCDGSGYWTSDRNYFSGGRGLNRQTFQRLS